MKTIHWVLIFVAVAAVGVGAYFMFFKKKKTPNIVPTTKPASAQSTGNQVLSFAENLGKKALGDFANSFLS